MSDLLQEALSAEQRGDIALAKQLLSQALIQDPNNETAWMLMADAVDDVRLRRNCLERVLAINPYNFDASTALTKLNTSPLEPVTRGERDKPIIPPRFDKIPPFTPPFTWGSDQEQYLALGDLTYPDLPEEQSAQPIDTTPTFDWAHDSDEPDKTIDTLFYAVSNPELASQPLPDTDLSWLDDNPTDALTDTAPEVQGDGGVWMDELVSTEVTPLPEQQTDAMNDFTVSAELELGMEAFTSPEALETHVSDDHQLWDNPRAKKDRLVILSNKSLIYANPKESDIPHILGLFTENKMVRDLLGDNARVIPYENIRRLTANPKKAVITINYQNKSEKTSIHKLFFSSPQVCDEVLSAIQLKPGVEFQKSIQTFRLQDKIVPPLAILLLLIFLIWVLYAGLPMLSGLTGGELGVFQLFVSFLQGFVTFAGRSNLLWIILLCSIVDLAWLVSNLLKPSELIILEGR
ncbi:MAG: hypothetical protein A2Z71_11695 [Chloroflexi bacterium RBG_13_50_21]|nr:MAG: hypothetical protein A2Z71_11695 [Chloroflexi bacterium RBG_13_50_21]